MIRIIIALLLLTIPALAAEHEQSHHRRGCWWALPARCVHLADSNVLDGRYGAPIALPAAEDAARMERIRRALHLDDGDGGRVNPGNDGYGIGQGRCAQHPDWRGCGDAGGR
jgi:hypothetical protein